MMSTDLVSVLSRPAERATSARVRGKASRSIPSAVSDDEDDVGTSSRHLSSDLTLDGPMPVFRRRGYYLDLLI